MVVFVDKLKSILDEVNKKNAQQSSINLFFTLKDKFKWTHCEYDLMASKTIVFFHGKVNWTFKPSSSSVASTSTPSETSGNYLFMTNSLILACAEEKGRSYTELETLYVDSTTLRDADSKKNELTLKARPRKGESPPASVGTLVIQSTDYLSLMNYKRFFDDCKESVPQHPLIPVGKGATPVVLGAPQPPPHPPHSPSKGTRSFTIASIECPPPLPPVKTAAAAQNTAVNGGSGNGSVTPHPKKVRTARGLGVEDAVELFYRKEDAPASQVFVSVAQNGSGGGGSSGNNNNNSGSNGSSKKDKKKQIESEKDLAAESKSTSNDSHSIDDEEEITTTGSPQNFSVSLNIGSSGSSSSSSGKSKKNRRSTYSLK